MQELVLEVEKLVWRGRGLARLDSGQVVLIEPGVFPGERIRGQVTEQRRDYLQLQWTRIERPAPYRRPHPCGLARECGGCRFGAVPAVEQLRLKERLLVSELSRALGRKAAPATWPEVQCFPAPRPWRYRYRGQIHVQGRRPHLKKPRSGEAVELSDCLLLARPLGRRIPDLSWSLPDGRHCLAASPTDGSALTGNDPGLLALPFRDHPFRLLVSPQVFFQANWALNQDLIAFVRSRLEPFGRVADLYAGAGNFALPLTGAGCSVLALEADPRAVDCVRRSLAEAGLAGVDVRRGHLGGSGTVSHLQRAGVRAAVLDPPRAGTGKRLTGMLDAAGLERLVWVSCDVVNTGRDLAPLLQSGEWMVRELAVFDMFPQTWHVEAVLVLDRAGGPGGSGSGNAVLDSEA